MGARALIVVVAAAAAGCGSKPERTTTPTETKPIGPAEQQKPPLEQPKHGEDGPGTSGNIPPDAGNSGDEGGGGGDKHSHSNALTSEHRHDFTPCESVVEDHAPGNVDRYRFEDPATGLVGFKNGAGTIVIKPQFRYAYEFGPGGISAAVDGTTFVFIDKSGKVIAKAYAFDNGPDYFQEGVARIVDAKGKVGFIDTKGKIVIAPQYDDAASFCNGKAEVAVGAKTFVIDLLGKTVAP
jgi:hypothetical protein